jgi:hypothetical protein
MAPTSNILLGKVILALSRYVEHVNDKKKILAFAKRQLKNSRNATRKKAEAFLNSHLNLSSVCS